MINDDCFFDGAYLSGEHINGQLHLKDSWNRTFKSIFDAHGVSELGLSVDTESHN